MSLLPFAAEITPTAGRWPASRVALHGLAWAGVALLPKTVDTLLQHTPPPGARDWFVLVPTAMMAGFFYLNSLVLIPRFLAQRQVGRYFGGVVLAVAGIVGTVSLIIWGLLRAGVVADTQPSQRPSPVLAALVLCGVVWALSSWGRITGEWFEAERRRRDLENGQLAAELALLKSQVSPHTLFNTLNSIYSLACLKSDDAPVAILKLSLLLRYMLYEADAPRVPLAREIELLENYIDLQRLRLDEQQLIHFEIEGDTTGYLIEPMLLIPFVENAFKHGVSYARPTPIEVRLFVGAGQLRFEVRNRCFGVSGQPTPAPGGLGLPNSERRLALLYPGRHQLQAAAEGDFFTVELTVQLGPAAPALPAAALPHSTAFA